MLPTSVASPGRGYKAEQGKDKSTHQLDDYQSSHVDLQRIRVKTIIFGRLAMRNGQSANYPVSLIPRFLLAFQCSH